MSKQEPPTEEPDFEWLVQLAAKVGLNEIRVRWQLLALARRWAALRQEAGPATSRRFRHQKCWSCGQIRHIDEIRCGACGAALGSKYLAFMRAIGFVLPPSLSVSALLAALNLGIYARLWLLEGSSALALSPQNLLFHGAHGSHGFADPHAWWRVGAAMFLHFSVLHVGMNMVALMQVGPSLEDLLGRGEMLLVYVLTGIAGNLVSELRSGPFIGAGASGAIMGMIGLAAGLGHASHSTDGRAIRDRMLKWGAYTLLFGLAVSADNLAHAGGFVVGGLWGLARAKTAVFRGQPPSHPLLGAVGALLLAGSALPPLLVRLSPEQQAELRAASAQEFAGVDDEEPNLDHCERDMAPRMREVWELIPAESRRGSYEQYIARMCDSMRDELALRQAALAEARTKEYPISEPLPRSTVTLDAVLWKLEADGAADARATYKRWAVALGDRLRGREPFAVSGTRGVYRVLVPEDAQSTALLGDATAMAVPVTGADADRVPRALAVIATEGRNVALAGVGDFLVRPCRDVEKGPCVAFAVGSALEGYALGKLDRAELIAAIDAQPPAADDASRSIALVEQTIHHVQSSGLIPSPRPVPSDVLERLTLPGDRPLPPCLRRWLAFDGTILFRDPSQPDFHLLSAGDRWAQLFFPYSEWQKTIDAVLPGDTIPLPGGDQTRRVLYLGSYDPNGELPVVYLDADDVPTVGIEGSFAVYLASHYETPGYERADQEGPGRRFGFDNLGGRSTFSAW